MPSVLSEDELHAALARLPGWAIEAGVLVKSYPFSAYMSGIAFVGRLAAKAEAANHHPDLHISWRKVRVELSTHSAGGITALDVELALVADALAAEESEA